MAAGAGVTRVRGMCLVAGGSLLILLAVLAVVRDVETCPVENETGTG